VENAAMLTSPFGRTFGLLVLSTATVACGGSGSSSTAHPAPAATLAPGARLALAAGTITWTAPGASMAVALRADGAFDVTATYRERKDGPEETARRSGRLTAGGDLLIDSQVVARVDDQGAVTVLHEREVIESGAVVKSDSSWEQVGVLDQKGVFTGKDGKRLSVSPDGKLTGIPAGMTITVDVGGAPVHNRTAVFLIVASFSASKQTASSDGPVKPADEGAPPAAPAPAPAPAPATK
jgi:hypothetical protein